jgi:hypothetical protein
VDDADLVRGPEACRDLARDPERPGDGELSFPAEDLGEIFEPLSICFEGTFTTRERERLRSD